jgi:pseudouridine kinase
MTTSNKRPNIILIGGAELSIKNRPIGQLQYGPENPGTISIDCGCKAWNMALDLAHKDSKVEFISVAGNDFAGLAMKAQLAKIGVGVEHFHLIDGKDTAATHEILNLLDQPEMEFQNVDVFAHMTTDMIAQAAKSISLADCILLETCFSEEVIQYIANNFSQVPILLLPNSEENAGKAKTIIDKIKGILIGRRAAEVLSGLCILSEEEMLEAGEWFFDAGIGQVFFDLGFGGVYYKDQFGAGVKRPGPISPVAIVEGFVRKRTAAETAAQAIKQEVSNVIYSKNQ